MSELSINNTEVIITYNTGYVINENGEKMDLPEDIKKKYTDMLRKAMGRVNEYPKNPDYWYKSIRPVRDINHKLVKKRLKQGWEIDSHDGYLLVMRKRKKPKIEIVKS